MKRKGSNTTAATVPLVRCAIYTRKSTEEGLEQEFNSLDAQREAGELFVRSQAGEGWTLLADRYDDGGFTGGNMERPALLRLMADIEAGKDYPRKVNQKVLLEAGLTESLGDTFASGEGIEDRLFLHPSVLFQTDEIDGLMTKINLGKDARHEGIMNVLLKMYTSASALYPMRVKAGKEAGVIDQPCLCIFGTAVPKLFYESLSARLMTNGFLARLLILECGPRGEGRDDVYRPLPASILEAARWWADFRPGGNLGGEHPVPRLVPTTPDALAAFADLRRRIDATYDECQAVGDNPGMAIWARAYEKARRLALIYACSVDRENPVVTPEAAAWAGTFALHQTQRMLYMARQHASESEFDARRKRLLDVLEQWRRQHGDEWMPLWRVNRKLPWSPREHEEVRDTLLQQRLIEYRVTTTRGRPGAVYRLPPATATEGAA
jgi:hypothetical protein